MAVLGAILIESGIVQEHPNAFGGRELVAGSIGVLVERQEDTAVPFILGKIVEQLGLHT